MESKYVEQAEVGEKEVVVEIAGRGENDEEEMEESKVCFVQGAVVI